MHRWQNARVADDERRRRMCTGKTRFRDQSAADLAVRNAAWGEGTRLRSYRCEYCDRWHLTSQIDR